MRTLLFLFILLQFQKSFGQQKLIYSDEHKPVKYANVHTNRFGTISNEEGKISLESFAKGDSITISHVGYEDIKKGYDELLQNDTIYLKASSILLDEVVLNGFKTRDTIVKAISKIPINYITSDYNSLGLYRHSLIEDGVGVEMSETYVLSYHPKYKVKKSIQAKILNGKTTKNHSKYRLQNVGGVVPVLNMADVVKNGNYMLSMDTIDNYLYTFDGIVKDELYVVSFRSKNTNDLNAYRLGKLYIEKTSLAIVEIKVNRDKEKLLKINEDNQRPSSKTPQFYPVNVETTMRYRKSYDDKYVLSFVNGLNNIEGVYKNKIRIYELKYKFMSSDVQITNIKKVKTNYNTNEPFRVQEKGMSSNEFWHENKTEFVFTDKEKKILSDIEKQN